MEAINFLPTPDDNQGLNLSSDVAPVEPISLAPIIGTTQPPTPQVAARRTIKTQLGNILPDYTGDILHQQFIQGQEDGLRKEAVLKMDYENRQKHATDLRLLAGSAVGAMDMNAYFGLTPPKPTDPDMVIEKGYTNSTLGALSTAATTLKDTPWTDAAKSFPEIQQQTVQAASDFGTKREFLQTYKENIEQVVEGQTYTGRAIDEVKKFSQFYQEAKLRGNIDGVSIFAGLGLGSNIQEQAIKLFSMDNETFKNTIAPILAKLREDNPSLAQEYVEKLLGQSDSERVLSNVFTVFAPFDVYEGSKISYKIGQRMIVKNQTAKAVRDILAESRRPDATAADITAAAGDLKGAGVQKVADDIVKGFEGTLDPAKPTEQAMTQNFRFDIYNIAEDVSNNRQREIATRLQDNLTSKTKNIPAAIMGANKVERIPLPLASAENVAAVEASLKDGYRGPWNSLLEIKIHPEDYDSFTNTHWYRMHLGRDGAYFSNPETAANWTRDNGIGEARILKGEGQVASAAEEKVLTDIRAAEMRKAEYQRLASDQDKIYRDPKSTPEAKVAAKETRDSINNVGVAKQDKLIQELQMKTANPENAKRLAKIKTDIEGLKSTEKIKTPAVKVSLGDAKEGTYRGKTVEIVNELPFKGNDGRMYQKIKLEGRSSSVRVSELTVKPGEEKVFTGKTHEDATKAFYKAHPEEETKAGNLEEGFVTTKDRYIKREEAGALPKVDPNQIKQLEEEARALNYGRASAMRTGPTVRQQGVGYYVEVRRPLNETQPVIRDLMIKGLDKKFNPDAISDATSGISAWKNAFFGKFRSPEDTLSKLESKQRKTAVYSEAVLQKLGDDLGQSIEDISRGLKRFDDVTGTPIPWYFSRPRYYLGKPFNIIRDLAQKAGLDVGGNRQMFKEWEATVDYARRAIDPITKEEGYFFKTLPELEDHYLRTYQRLPSYSESEAYFAKVLLDEYNRVLTNIAVYRNKARLGTESHAITYVDAGTRVISERFDGVSKQEFPGGDGNIFAMDNSSGKKGRVFSLGNIPEKLHSSWIEQVKNGKLKVVEIFDPEARPLKDFAGISNQRVQYVLSDALDSQPISMNQVNRRGGGHFDYKYDHYLKQAIIRRDEVGSDIQDHYEGDTSVMALPNRVMGRDIGEHLNNVREMIKADQIDAARAYTRKHLMMEPDEVQSWFKPGRDINGKEMPPRLNLNEPFVVVGKGETIFGIDKELEKRYTFRDAAGNEHRTFRDGTRHGSLARQFQVAYTKERDAKGLIAPENVGTRNKPLYKYEPAKLVDAMPTMNRALNRAIKSTFMDDYKIFAIEHWLREAEPHLKPTESEIRSSPFYHFNNPVFKPDVAREVKNNLISNQYKINQFVGIPSEFDTNIHALTQKLADSMYEAGAKVNKDSKFSDIKSLEDTKIIPIWMLNKIHDPVTKLRAITFNAKLGIFNLPQLLVQAQTHASIWAIAGRTGGAGTYAALLHQWSRFGDEAFLQHLDKYATRMNFLGVKWRPGEFAEARHELARTGFEHVGGEFATLDDAFAHKFVKNDFQKFLDMGQVFFKEGERSTRLSAYYTAFKEFRDVHPTGALTAADRGNILQRADLLTTNMSRASSSALHGGVLGLTTQFLSYQLRLAELFMGKRLGNTVQERAMARMRMFGMYSALYGVPAAFGVTGLPVSEDFRAAAINRGYIVGENFTNSLFMEGIPAMLVALITGEGDYKKGQFYNVGDRYGAQGFTQLREALRSDAAWWKILGGAGVSTAVNTLTNADGFTKAIMSFARGDSADSRFKIKGDDLVDLGKEISSVNSSWKLLVALNTGKWLAKNEGYISDVSKPSALWMTLTGLSPQEQDDIFVKSNIKKSEVALQKYVLNKYVEEIHRMIAAKEAGNNEQSHDYLRRASNYLEIGNFPMDKRMQAIALASKGWESRIDSANFDYYLKNVPTDQSETRRETFKNQARLNQYRKQ